MKEQEGKGGSYDRLTINSLTFAQLKMQQHMQEGLELKFK